MDVVAAGRVEAPRLAVRVAACSLSVFFAAVPLGLLHLGHAGLVCTVVAGNSLCGWGTGAEPFDAWTYLLGRLALVMPLSDLATRLGLISAGLAAVGVGLWIRVGLELAQLLYRKPLARGVANDKVHEPIAIVGAVSAVAMAAPLFSLSTSPGGGNAMLCLVAAWTWSALVLLREPLGFRAPLSLAAIAGLVAATTPTIGSLLLPPTILIWAWGVRRQARWALLMPLSLVIGSTVLVAFAAHRQGSLSTFEGWWHTLTLGPLRDAMDRVDARAWWSAATALADHVGVVGGLLVVVGFASLALARPGVAAFVLYTLWATMMLVAGSGSPDQLKSDGWALCAWISIAAVPLAAGILHFASKLGRAKLPATIALVVMAIVAPLLSGGLSRWHPDGRMSLRLLTRAQWNLAPRSEVDPGSVPMSMAFKYGNALGLRPDLRARSSKPAVTR